MVRFRHCTVHLFPLLYTPCASNHFPLDSKKQRAWNNIQHAMKSISFRAGTKGNNWGKKRQFNAAIFFPPAEDLRPSGGFFWVGHLALNWSSIFLFSPPSVFITHTHIHTFLCFSPHIPLPCLRWLFGISLRLSDVTVRLLMVDSSCEDQSGVLFLPHSRNRDGLMKPPTQPGHSLTCCTSNFLPSGVTRAKLTGFKTTTERPPSLLFCFIFLLALIQIIIIQSANSHQHRLLCWHRTIKLQPENEIRWNLIRPDITHSAKDA